MFEELFTGPIALARQRESPLPEERRQFLCHLKDLGYARSSLRDVACELVVIVRRLDLSGDTRVPVAAVDVAARQWAMEQMRRHRSTKAAISVRNFRYWATQWLRFLGRLEEPAPVAAPPYQELLDGFTAYMRDERGLTSASIRSHGWKTKTFLAWYWPQGRAFADVAIQDVDEFLIAKGRATWSRRSVAVAVQALRAFFRYAERAGHCRPGIAAAITGPRLYHGETLPAGPPWADVHAILSRAPDRPAAIRRAAALWLFATYGFRVGEVARLTLDDIDWEQERIRIRRVKRHGVQTYPLSREAGAALARYLAEVRPESRWREVFLTLQAPCRPLSPAGFYPLVSGVLSGRGLQLRHHGPHALRHACATRLLSRGLSVKEIGDYLGHRSTDATAVYAKVDGASLGEVARFDLGGVL